MAEEATRKLLRVFGVTVTNFEDRNAELLERAKRLRETGDVSTQAGLLKEVCDTLMELQARWLELTDHIAQRQRLLLSELAAVAEELSRK